MNVDRGRLWVVGLLVIGLVYLFTATLVPQGCGSLPSGPFCREWLPEVGWALITGWAAATVVLLGTKSIKRQGIGGWLWPPLVAGVGTLLMQAKLLPRVPFSSLPGAAALPVVSALQILLLAVLMAYFAEGKPGSEKARKLGMSLLVGSLGFLVGGLWSMYRFAAEPLAAAEELCRDRGLGRGTLIEACIRSNEGLGGTWQPFALFVTCPAAGAALLWFSPLEVDDDAV